MFVEQLLDYSYEHECIWASATLYSVPQGICCEYVREAVTEKSGRMGERECVLGCVQKLILIARGLKRGSCSLTYLYLRPLILNAAN